MAIKVLLADDSYVMLSAMRKTLEEDSRIKVVGEATSFEAAIRMIPDVRPDVLLLDLHLPEMHSVQPDAVKSQLASVPCLLAVSLSNDSEAKELAKSYGATSLLDKMNLYTEMIPAIMSC